MQRRRRAFTLVELLVVIGIIMVLIGIMLATLSRAQDAARTAQCLSNLRQMGQAAAAYVAENRGSYPPAQWNVSFVPGADRFEWDFVRYGVTPARPGLLWGGHGTAKIQQCPSFDGRANSSGDPFTGYNYNTSYIGRGRNERVEAPAKFAQVRRPSETILFGDGQWSLGANKFMRAPLPSEFEDGDVVFAAGTTARAGGTQGFRHARGRFTNAAFCDGHAESLRDRFTAGNSNVAAGTGFVTADNSLYDLH